MFIEVTRITGKKGIINSDIILSVYPHEKTATTGCIITLSETSSEGDNHIALDVMESYEYFKELLKSSSSPIDAKNYRHGEFIQNFEDEG